MFVQCIVDRDFARAGHVVDDPLYHIVMFGCEVPCSQVGRSWGPTGVPDLA